MNTELAPLSEPTPAPAQTEREYEQHRDNVANIKTALQLMSGLAARARLWRMLIDELRASHAGVPQS